MVNHSIISQLALWISFSVIRLEIADAAKIQGHMVWHSVCKIGRIIIILQLNPVYISHGEIVDVLDNEANNVQLSGTLTDLRLISHYSSRYRELLRDSR